MERATAIASNLVAHLVTPLSHISITHSPSTHLILNALALIQEPRGQLSKKTIVNTKFQTASNSGAYCKVCITHGHLPSHQKVWGLQGQSEQFQEACCILLIHHSTVVRQGHWHLGVNDGVLIANGESCGSDGQDGYLGWVDDSREFFNAKHSQVGNTADKTDKKVENTAGKQVQDGILKFTAIT